MFDYNNWKMLLIHLKINYFFDKVEETSHKSWQSALNLKVSGMVKIKK